MSMAKTKHETLDLFSFSQCKTLSFSSNIIEEYAATTSLRRTYLKVT
jgi:hypothetical protein